MSIGIGINESYWLNPHIERAQRDAADVVKQLVKVLETAYGADELYRRIADEATRNIRVQFGMKPDELVENVTNDFRKALANMSTTALITHTEKVSKYMNLSDTEKIMAATVDKTIYSYVCEHLNDDDVYVEMKKVYDHFIAA